MALQTQDLAQAVVEAHKLAGEAMVKEEARTGTLDEAIPLYLKEKEADTRGTQRSRKMILDVFRRCVGNVKVSSISEAMIRGWIEKLEREGAPRLEGDKRKPKPIVPATTKSYLITLRAFVNWCRRRGYLRGDPFAELRRKLRIKVSRVDSFLTVDERERLLAAEASEELRFILHFGFFQGLRFEEMLAMKQGWLWVADDWSRGTVTVQATPVITKDGTRSLWLPKDKESRTVPLHERTLAFLKDYGMREPFMLAPHKRWWPSASSSAYRYDPRKTLDGLAERAEVGHVTYHMLRHSFGTHLAMAGVEMRTVAELLGDGLAVTEQHYIGYSPNKANPLAAL